MDNYRDRGAHVLLRDGRECTVELDSLTIVGRIAAREISEELSWVESPTVRGCIKNGGG